MTEKEQKNKEQAKLYNIYGLFAASIILCVIPNLLCAALSLIGFIALLVTGYMMRGKAEKGSLIENHTTFIIRTVWISTLFSAIGLVLGVIYMIASIDYTPLESCIQTMVDAGIQEIRSLNPDEILAYTQPCMEGFFGMNKGLIVVISLLGFGLPVLYMAYRFIKGVVRAVKGYRLADHQSWF